MGEEYILEDGFETEEEVDAELEAILESVGKQATEEDEKTHIINPDRMREFMFAAKTLRLMTAGTTAKVTCVLFEPFKSFGSIHVTGKDIIVRNPSLFVKVARFASNVDIYPKIDGSVSIDFGFHGLAKIVD